MPAAPLRDDPLVAGLLARCEFPERRAVTCAVSGGADSAALLVLAVAAGHDVTAIHVDHGLRPGSSAESGRVAALAERFGAAFRAVQVSVAPGPNLEARCREARAAALPAGALTGHTADDQAETVLLNLLRGAGLPGLAGMRRPQHPLLALRRHETRGLCDHLGIDPVDDPSNADPTFRRNRLRHEALPLLGAIAERDVAAVIARQASVLADDDDLLERLAGTLDPTDAVALAAAEPALARRAVRRWLRAGDPNGHPPDAASVERVLAVARGEVVATEVAGGRRVGRSRQRLHLSPVPGDGPLGAGERVP